MQQRKSIRRNLQQQVATVCADSSLSAQQKKDKIHQLRQGARHEMEALITTQQQEALKACEQSRGRGHGGGAHGSGDGPCGEMPAPPK